MRPAAAPCKHVLMMGHAAAEILTAPWWALVVDFHLVYHTHSQTRYLNTSIKDGLNISKI